MFSDKAVIGKTHSGTGTWNALKYFWKSTEPHTNVQPRSQGLSSLPPLVVGRKTLVAAGHVTTCDTNFSTGVESTNNFCRSQLKRKKDHR